MTAHRVSVLHWNSGVVFSCRSLKSAPASLSRSSISFWVSSVQSNSFSIVFPSSLEKVSACCRDEPAVKKHLATVHSLVFDFVHLNSAVGTNDFQGKQLMIESCCILLIYMGTTISEIFLDV